MYKTFSRTTQREEMVGGFHSFSQIIKSDDSISSSFSSIESNVRNVFSSKSASKKI